MSEIVLPSAEVDELGSRPPDTIAAILERLDVADSFNGVFLHYGLVPKLPTERERLYLLGVAGYQRVPYSGGHRVRREAYDIRGLVEVAQLGAADSAQTVGRAWQLLDALDAVLVVDPDLVHAEYTHELRVIADEVVPSGDGWLARIVFALGMEGAR